MELYLSSALEYTGEREFFSKFGLEIRNNVTVILSKRTFSQRVPQNEFDRPREGDLIYVPVTNGTGELFEIKFVDHTKDFFSLGRPVPYFYEIHLEKFKYSNETIDTGIDEIDVVELQGSYTIDLLMSDAHDNYEFDEIVYQGNTFNTATATAQVSSWNANTKILQIININGTFTNSQNVKGVMSNTSIRLVSYDPLDVTLSREDYNNGVIQDEADQIIDFSESNPFGEI